MTTSQQVLNRTIEPIVLDNFVLDGESVRDADGKYFIKAQHGWEEHFAGLGKRLPTVAEYITIIKQLDERNDSALGSIIQDLRESALCTGTKIYYRNSNLPQGDGYLDVLIKYPAWKRALEDELLQYDAAEAASVLQKASGKRPYIWTPSAESRKSNPERAVWLGIDAGWFNLDCGNLPINISGRARGVREVGGAAGARDEKTAEQVLDEKVQEELSRFDGFAGTYSQEKYAEIKQKVAQNLKGLYRNRG